MHGNPVNPFIAALVTAVLTASSGPVGSSTVVPLSLSDLTARADRIFHGTCVGVRSELVAGDIVTRLTFAVDEGLKGTVGDTLALRLPGGELDGVRDEVSGMPSFVPGDEVVLFVTEVDGLGRVWPVGLGQGDFRVLREGNRPAAVGRSLDDLRLPGGAAARPTGLPPTPTSLEALLEEIRGLIGASSGGAAR